MKTLAVIGNPISHSKSPQIFRHLSSVSGVPLKYGRIELPANCNTPLFRKVALSLDAVNVTSPFKELAVKAADTLSDEVKKINACNLLVSRNGTLTAYNTDIFGINKGLEKYTGGNILLLGVGGAAKAVAYLLSTKKLPAFVCNRTEAKAEKLAKNFELQFISANELAKTDFTTIINTVPSTEYVTMVLKKLNTTIDLFIDAIYPAPAYSTLSQIKHYISGEVWLWSQALKGFEIITGKEIILNEMPQLETNTNLKHITINNPAHVKENIDFERVITIK